jgi:hypothetical protein
MANGKDCVISPCWFASAPADLGGWNQVDASNQRYPLIGNQRPGGRRHASGGVGVSRLGVHLPTFAPPPIRGVHRGPQPAAEARGGHLATQACELCKECHFSRATCTSTPCGGPPPIMPVRCTRSTHHGASLPQPCKNSSCPCRGQVSQPLLKR